MAALTALVRARRGLEDAEGELRKTLLKSGVSLAQIGRVYGISRQAARERFKGDLPEG